METQELTMLTPPESWPTLSALVGPMLCGACGCPAEKHTHRATHPTGRERRERFDAWCPCGACYIPRHVNAPGVYLYGENNPHSSSPSHALLPWPAMASGDKLRRHLGLTHAEYLIAFARRNLCPHHKWDTRVARQNAADAVRAHPNGRFILLGSKVTGAFMSAMGLVTKPKSFDLVQDEGTLLCVLPHPSGLSRAWNASDASAKAQTAVATLLLAGKGA